MPRETWKRVPSRFGVEVSSLGRVRIGSTIKEPTPNKKGYLVVRIATDVVYVHQMVCEAFHGPRPEGQEVLHRDDDKSNCRARNLRWGTRSENLIDASRNGTHPAAKLSADDVRAIRRSTERGAVLAARYGISTEHANRIRRGETHAWVS